MLLLFAVPVEVSFGDGAGVVLPESVVWPLVLYLIAFPLAMPVAAWVWIRAARAAIAPHRRQHWVPALALVLFGLQTALWIPFIVVLSRD